MLRGGERLSDSVKSGGTGTRGSVGARSVAVSARTTSSSGITASVGSARVTASQAPSSSRRTPGPKSASGSKLSAPSKLEPSERPGASGHRFGPDLACSECGIQWDVHQREPHPCKTDLDDEADAFLRRPAPPAANVEVDRAPAGSGKTSVAEDPARSTSQGPGPRAASDASADPTGDR